MMIEISLEGLDDPHDIHLKGGPFDGSSIRIAVDLLEHPPKRITFGWFSPDDANSSRGAAKEHYFLFDDEGDYGYRYEGPSSS
jgi:hypothetical protein